jgi:biopolymer transport protein TolQ
LERLLTLLFLPALTAAAPPSLWSLVSNSTPLSMAVLLFLVAASCFSWGIIFSKWKHLSRARAENGKFLRAFRKASGFEAVAAACEQFAAAPLVVVYDFGYAEVERQVRSKQRLTNRTAVERSLQIGAGEEIARLEKNLNWLATTAAITPFIGLFGTVWGIINAFQALTGAGAASLRAVGPGIAEALVATAMGLFAAIPAAIFYNYFGFVVRDLSARMDDFALEFMNLIERVYEG